MESEGIFKVLAFKYPTDMRVLIYPNFQVALYAGSIK